MSTEENKALVRRFYGKGVRNPALFDELLAPSYVLTLSWQLTHFWHRTGQTNDGRLHLRLPRPPAHD